MKAIQFLLRGGRPDPKDNDEIFPLTPLSGISWSFSEPVPNSPDEMAKAIVAYQKNSRSIPFLLEALPLLIRTDRIDATYTCNVRQPNGESKEIFVTVEIDGKGKELSSLDILWQLHQRAHEDLINQEEHCFDGLLMDLKQLVRGIPRYNVLLCRDYGEQAPTVDGPFALASEAVEHYRAEKDEPLYGFYQNGKFGFFNRDLQIAIPAIYDSGNPWNSGFGDFSDGFAMVIRSGRSLFIDKSGRTLGIEDPSLRPARDFCEGLAVVHGEHNGKRVAGFIDTTGKIIIEPREEFAAVGYWSIRTSVERFSCGLALIAQHQDEGAGNRYLGYIDRNGDWAIRGDFEFAGNFSEGLAAVKRDGKIGCIDTSGQWVIEPQYRYISSFVEGLAPFETLGKFGETKWGVIDRTSAVVVEPAFDDMYPYRFGIARVRNSPKSGPARDLYGAIDKRGALVVPLAYQDMTWFSDGLAGVVEIGVDQWSGNAWGVIDTNGKYVIPPGLGYIFGFRDGLSRMRFSIDDKDTCYIDRTGKVVWKTLYSESQRRS